MGRQIRELGSGIQVLIACPGRLVDHLERGTVRLDRIELLVVDEADRMLDMGFLPQLRKILRVMKKPRQNLMFSATMDPQVELLARDFLTEPARLRIGDTATPPAAIRQTIFPVPQESKAAVLLHLLRRDGVASAIVFARTRSRADRVAKLLVRNLVNAVVIHGGRSQNQRNAALAGFRNGQYTVLVATDVAARGLDIPGVSHVINFDLPEAPAAYIHRIGRTARMGKSGEALSLVMPEDGASLRGIESTLGVRLERGSIRGIAMPQLAAAAAQPVKRHLAAGHVPASVHRVRHKLASRLAAGSFRRRQGA